MPGCTVLLLCRLMCCTLSLVPALWRLQNVVIMGTGSFALEAMEAAGRNNAKHITLVSRPRKR